MRPRPGPRRGFYRALDTMLFRAAEPDRRYQVLERFYRLGPDLVQRFYAAESRRTDQLRILSGRPPVPIGRAMRSLVGRSAPDLIARRRSGLGRPVT